MTGEEPAPPATTVSCECACVLPFYVLEYILPLSLSVAVNWGDGTTTVDNLDNFGPYQKLHQYAGSDRTYGITVHYCSNPSPGWSSQRCCDSMYRTIDVSYDPPFY